MLGRGNTEKYGISSSHYVRECPRYDDCCLIPGAAGNGLAVEITEKISRSQYDYLQMQFVLHGGSGIY